MGYSKAAIASFLFVFPCLALSYQCRYQKSESSIEKSALMEFKNGIVDDPGNVLGNWNHTTEVCNWNGVHCNSGRVTTLYLKSKSLRGTISPFLSNLSCLIFLELTDNKLQGTIPAALGALRSLQILGLSENNLTHDIPESLGLLDDIRNIDLSRNKLHGSLPVALFYNCTKLACIDLSDNFLNGSIPPQIGQHIPQLEILRLYSNRLVGFIPDSLYNSTKMKELDLESNLLTGTLPSKIIAHMSLLEILRLSCNNFCSDDKNTNLTPFFTALSNLSHLEKLQLVGSNLGGQLPFSIGLLGVNISQIRLQDNAISGAIPLSIGNLSSLILLNLSDNHLNGTIPSEIEGLSKLQGLFLSNNLLKGPIPASLGTLSSLNELDLSENMLAGGIPNFLTSMNQLSKLVLHTNFLSGTIRASLAKCENLQVLDLSYNRLTGSIPHEIAELRSMDIYINLSNNCLTGEIPSELSKMDRVLEIDLSSNQFSGKIPVSLENCKAVVLLNFSNNSLDGPIPASIGELQNLQTLDLSHNILSGEIPASLSKMPKLQYANFSFNNFHGLLPQGGFFYYLTADSVMGNPLLCGAQTFLQRCYFKNGNFFHSRGFLTLLVTVVSTSAFLLTICCKVGPKRLMRPFSTQNEANSSSSLLSISSSYPRITYNEIWEATGGFHQSGLIGSGSFGHVYRGVLYDGTRVAVKVLQLQAVNSTNSFTRECQVLKRIRHRNLMRLITACSLPDFKALVLPFMANGSLDGQLYPKGKNVVLNLIDRVNICSDVAEGIAYLHHHSPVQIIHCDLKPSNILLNDDMTALVSDFGIAKLVLTIGEENTRMESTTSSTATLLCGSIGYVAPEYGLGKRPTTMGDVYSFGIVVLETITRRRPTEEMFCEGMSLQRWVKTHCHSQLNEVVDPSLMETMRGQNPDIASMWEVAMLELLQLGLLCAQETPSARPSMIDVAADLDRLKRYLSGDASATFTPSFGVSSSIITRDDW